MSERRANYRVGEGVIGRIVGCNLGEFIGVVGEWLSRD